MEKLTGKKGVIFDFDMTLLDTKEDIAGSLAYIFKDYTGKEITAEKLLPHIGVGLQTMLNMFVPGIKVGSKEYLEKMFQFQAYYKEHCNIKTHPYPGVMTTLKELEKRGYALAVATNKHGNIARHVARKNGMDGFFGHFQGTEKMIGKPDPAVILSCLEAIGLKVEDVICVGDKANDVSAAKAAGCQTVSVSYGVDSRAKLEQAGPDFIIDKFDELLKIL